MIVHPWKVDLGWLHSASPGFPGIPVIAGVLVGALVITLGVFLEPENRYRGAFAVAAVNLAFVAMLGAALHVHASFSRRCLALRLSDALIHENLAEGIQGGWAVTARETPGGSTEFPARALFFDRWGAVAASPARSSERVWTWWRIETDVVPRSTTLPFERFIFWRPLPDSIPILSVLKRPGPYKRPILLLDTESAPAVDGVVHDHLAWVGELREVQPSVIVLASLDDYGAGRAPSRVWLRRVERPMARFDLRHDPAFVLNLR